MNWSSLVPFFLLIWGLAAVLQLIRALRAGGVDVRILARDFVVSGTAVSLVLIADEARRSGLISFGAFVIVLIVAGAGLAVLMRVPDAE